MKHGLWIFLCLVVGVILFIIAINGCLALISAPDTLFNILGALGILVVIALSVVTRCLTVFIKRKEDD